MYELRLIEADGRTVGLYGFDCRNDEQARAGIFGVTEPYARYEIWRGMERIAAGPRFVCANGPLFPLTLSLRAAA